MEVAVAHFLASRAECESTDLLDGAVSYLRRRGVSQFFAMGPSGGYEPLTVTEAH